MQQKPKGLVLHTQVHDWRHTRHQISCAISGVIIGFFVLIILLKGSFSDIVWGIVHYAFIFAMIWYPHSLGRIFFSISFLFPLGWLRDDPKHREDFGWFVSIGGWIWLLWPCVALAVAIAAR